MVQAARNSSCKPNQKSAPLNLQRLGLLFLLIIVSLLIALSYFVVNQLKNNESVAINKLIIMGERNFTTDDDIRHIVLSQGKLPSFVMENVSTLQQQILENLPWVNQVNIHKQWPDTLIINIIENQPIAYWNDKFFIDNTAKIFTLPITRLKNKAMPLLFGPDDQQSLVLSCYDEVNDYLKSINRQAVLVSLNARYAWMLILDNGIRVELGQNDRILRLKRFITLYPLIIEQIPPDQRVKYVDMRYKSGVAVGYTPII